MRPARRPAAAVDVLDEVSWHARRTMSARVHPPLLAALLALAVLVGCGDDRPEESDVRDAQKSATQPLYWAGDEVAGQALTGIVRNGGVVTFLYGDCKLPDGEGGCPAPISVQAAPSAMSKGSSSTYARRRPPGARHHGARAAPAPSTSRPGRRTSRSAPTPRRASSARWPHCGRSRGASRAELPPPRYPLAYIQELRLVRDTYRALRQRARGARPAAVSRGAPCAAAGVRARAGGSARCAGRGRVRARGGVPARAGVLSEGGRLLRGPAEGPERPAVTSRRGTESRRARS